MSNFRHILNVKTRAIAPEYHAQWSDRIVTYAVIPDGADFIIADYPYSIGNIQIMDSPYALDGVVSDCTMLTISGEPMLTAAGPQMKRI